MLHHRHRNDLGLSRSGNRPLQLAFFDRVPALDWDAAYREIPAASDGRRGMGDYYEALNASWLLQTAHSLVVPPEALYRT
jgi:hypothetical protein